MSRSRRREPICGITTSETEKWWKRAIHAAVRVRVRSRHYDDHSLMPDIKEVGMSYGPKDGKQRINPDDHPEIMRK